MLRLESLQYMCTNAQTGSLQHMCTNLHYMCSTCAHCKQKKKGRKQSRNLLPRCIKVIELQSCKHIKYTTITMPAYDNYQHSHDHSQMESYNTEALQQFFRRVYTKINAMKTGLQPWGSSAGHGRQRKLFPCTPMALGLSVLLAGKLRNPNRHKDMPQKKEKLALPPSAITTLLQSSLLPQEKKTCANNNNLSSLLPGPRKQRPPPPHNKQT